MTASTDLRARAERLVELAKAATAAPWMYDRDPDDPYIGSDTGVVLAIDLDWLHEGDNHGMANDNADYIAAARNDAPEIAARMLELEPELDAAYKDLNVSAEDTIAEQAQEIERLRRLALSGADFAISWQKRAEKAEAEVVVRDKRIAELEAVCDRAYQEEMMREHGPTNGSQL